jgi:phage protein U
MILGDLVLPALAVKGLGVDDAWEYAAHAVIEGKPRRQFVAPDARGIPLSLYLHAEFIHPQQTIDRLRAFADAGEVLILQALSGLIYGHFVIEGISLRPKWTLPDGTIIATGVEVKLVEPGLETLLEVPAPIAVDGATSDTTNDPPPEDIPDGADPFDAAFDPARF